MNAVIAVSLYTFNLALFVPAVDVYFFMCYIVTFLDWCFILLFCKSDSCSH